MSESSLYTVLVALIALNGLFPADGARLLLAVDSMRSHVMYFSRLGIDLARLGHDVRVLAPSNAGVPDFVRKYKDDHETGFDQGTASDKPSYTTGKFNYTTFSVVDVQPFSDSPEYNEMILEQALANSVLEGILKSIGKWSQIMYEFNYDGHQLAMNAMIMDELRQGDYDFVITVPLIPFAAIPLAMKVPYGLMHISLSPLSYRVPRLPSFTPRIDNTDRMTFGERLVNCLMELLTATWFHFDRNEIHVNGSVTTDNLSLTLPNAIESSSLWLAFENPAVGYAVPHMPNTIPVADIAAGRLGLPLPAELENFVAASKDAVVIVSFGSYIDNLPDDIIGKFCEAFRRLGSGRHVIWKTKKLNTCSGIENVKTVPWIPQNDLLADPRVRLFITHGGLNSLMETVYHAKPVIVFPVYVDQPLNAAAAVAKGYAIRMELRSLTSDSLLVNIEKMFSDEKYQLNARLTSAILRDRRDTPAERVSYMIEHVIKYGDSHLRTGAFELNLVQFLMLDVFAFIYTIILIFVVIVVLIPRCLYRKLCRRNSESHKRKSD